MYSLSTTLAFSTLVTASTNALYTTFFNPPNFTAANGIEDTSITANKYLIGEEILLQFETGWDNIDLGVWVQGTGNNLLFYQLPGALSIPGTTTQFRWTIDLSGKDGGPIASSAEEQRFKFALFHHGQPFHIDSQYVQISNASSTTSTTTAPPITSPTTKSTSVSPTIPVTTSASVALASTSTTTSNVLISTPTSVEGTAQLSDHEPAVPADLTKVGLGVGFGVLAVIIVVLQIFYLSRRRRRHCRDADIAARKRGTVEDVSPALYHQWVSRDGLSFGGKSYVTQTEIPASHRGPTELSAHNVRYEAPG